MTKEKIESVFTRLDRLGLGDSEVDKDTIDPQESIWRADLFMSVISRSTCSTL